MLGYSVAPNNNHGTTKQAKDYEHQRWPLESFINSLEGKI